VFLRKDEPMKQRIFSILGMTVAILFLSVSYTNCAKTSSSGDSDQVQQQQNQNTQFYFHQMKTLIVDVVYEPGAEPFVGTTATGMNYWDLLEDNLVAIFSKQSMLFTVPHSLAEMRSIPAQGRTSWTPDQVLALAAQYRNGNNDSTTGRFFVVFLKGNAADGSGVNPNVLGYSVSGTNVIAMFKDVIKTTGTNPNGLVPRYVEQSTMVHEMGHALGFVNNGLPLTSAHHDSAHGAHCTNPNCVMYYLNEGKNDAINFVQQYITSGNTVMFDNACLQDSKSF
jgi:hypothetical protein